jgi:ribose transport system permease protein
MISVWKRWYFDYGVLPTIIIIATAAFGLAEPKFLSAATAANIAQQASLLIIPAIGQMFVLVNRGFDLSIGYAISFASLVAAITMHASIDVGDAFAGFAGVTTALVLGLGVGLVNGLCIAYLSINPFAVTLGTQGILFGASTIVSGGFPVAVASQSFVDFFGRGNTFGIPISVSICLSIIAVAHILMAHTTFGRTVYFTGDNPVAAHIAGLPTKRSILTCYLLCSLCGSVTAILLMARTGTGEPNLGGGIVLQSIAAAIIGGVSPRGGEGHVFHAVSGGVLLIVTAVGMDMARIDSNVQLILTGVVILVAVCLDRLRATAANSVAAVEEES